MGAVEFDFGGRAAVVTGGARGIGRGIAERLARGGARVMVWDADPAPLARSDADLEALTVDVGDESGVEAAARETVGRLGGIDILVNNAGVSGPTVALRDYPLSEWERVLRVDLTGVFLCCRAVVPLMEAAGYGRIVNVASVAAKDAVPNICAYVAAKAGVIALTRSLAREVAGSGILVNCTTPAMVETDLLAEMSAEHIASIKARMPLGRLGTVRENADLVAFLCSEACSFSTGAAFDVSGGRATW